MTEEEIDGVIADFAAAAVRAVDAGFDTIEIHGAHGYLLHQFQSPLVNDRTDRWGGDEAGRNRLTLAVVDAVRDVIPDSMPLLLRISASDWAEGGIDAEASVRMASAAAEHGVDLVDVSSGGAVAHQQIPRGTRLPDRLLRPDPARNRGQDRHRRAADLGRARPSMPSPPARPTVSSSPGRRCGTRTGGCGPRSSWAMTWPGRRSTNAPYPGTPSSGAFSRSKRPPAGVRLADDPSAHGGG